MNTTIDRNETLTVNYRLLLWAGSRAARRSSLVDRDEAVALTAERVVEKFHLYNPERGKLSTWVRKVARSAVRMEELSRRCAKRGFGRVRPLGDFPRSDGRPDHQVEVDDADELAVSFEPIKAAIAKLPPRAREAVTLRFGLGGERPLTLAEVADRWGGSKQAVQLSEARGLKLLRLALLGEAGAAAVPRYVHERAGAEVNDPGERTLPRWKVPRGHTIGWVPKKGRVRAKKPRPGGGVVARNFRTWAEAEAWLLGEG